MRKSRVRGNQELHYKYAIAALVLAVCAAVGFGMSDDARLVDKISFALTVNSLVLGFVAIIYTFMASNKQDAQLIKLLDTNSSISAAATEIRSASREMTEHFKKIPERFDNLDRQLDALSQASRQAVFDAEEDEEEEDEDEVEEDAGAENEDTESPVGDFRKYFLNLRYAGIASIYLFYKAHLANRHVTEDMCKESDTPSLAFHIGNIQAAEAGGFLKASISSTEIAPESISDEAMKELEGVSERLQDAMGNDNRLSKMLAAIDALLP